MFHHNITSSTLVNHKVNDQKLSFLYDCAMESKIREYLLEKQVVLGFETQDNMAAAIGVTKGALNKWLGGHSMPDYGSMKKIADGLGVPLQEVMDAVEGRYIPMPEPERQGVEISKKYSSGAIAKAVELSPDLIPVTYSVPIKGTVTAGGLMWAEEEELGFVPSIPGREKEGIFALKVIGDSMAPAIENGTLVYVKPVQECKPGKKYVIQTNHGETTLKVVYLSEDGLTLEPINPKCKPISVKKVDIAKVWEVVARVMMEDS